MSTPAAAPAAAGHPQDMTYEFDCPQYKDFNAPEDEHADAWFGPAEEDSASAEVFEGTAETAIPTAMETEQEATISTDSKTETQPEKLVIETHTEEAAVQTKIDEAAVETQTEEVQNVQPASSPKSRVQQLVESFETKAVAEPVVPQSKPVLSRASSIVKEAVAAIEEVVTAAPAAVEIVEIEAPIAATTESAVQEAEETKEETKAEEEAILSSITDAAVAPETEAVVETTDAEVAAEIEVGESKDEEQDSLIPATVNVDSPSFTNAANVSAEEVVDEATSSRISQVFGSLRSSLPLLSAGSQTLMFKSEEFKATDEEAAALHEAFENSTPRMEEPLVAAEESEVNESSDSITLQLAAQFAEVADSPITARTAAATAAATSSSSAKRVPSASPSRRVAVSNDIASSGSVPSFLRPTAGSISRAQAIAEAAAAAQAAAGHITRRPISVARAAAPVAPASTPKINKKRAASQDRLDELARPRTATKASSTKKDGAEAESHRPSTASKAHRRPSVAHAHSNAAAAAAAKLTVAQSPALVTRVRAKINHKPAVKSTEEAELALIAAEKEAVAATLRRNAAFFEKVADPAVHMSKEAQALPVRSATAVTQPEEFQFHTAKRAKIAAQAEPQAPVASSSAAKKDETPRMGEPTKPVPFSFQTALRAGPRRETLLLSSEEQEIQALKSIKPFKATPLPESILAAPAPLPTPQAKKSFQPTQATSPQLMTKERSKRKQEEEATVAATVAPAAAPAVAAAAASAAPSQQSAAKKPRREVQPFHLATEERGRRATEVFQSQREAEAAQERAAHNFHARPVGASAAVVPTAPIVAPIVPHCVELHREARAKFESKIHETEAAARAAREFHARPNPFTGAALAHDEALIVPAIKSDRPLTVPVTPALKSKARHAKREEFEESMKAREAELKRLQDQRAEEEAERQARELAKQRASMKPAVTALKPRILEGPTFVPQPSKAPLTQPESPMLITKRRGQAAMRRMSTVPQDDEESAVDQENQMPAAFAAPVESAVDDITAKVAQPAEPVEVSLVGDMDTALPLAAQFDAVAAE